MRAQHHTTACKYALGRVYILGNRTSVRSQLIVTAFKLESYQIHNGETWARMTSNYYAHVRVHNQIHQRVVQLEGERGGSTCRYP